MSGTFSDELENKLLDHAFGGGDYTREATLHFGLSSTDPGDDGQTATEPSTGSYARVAKTNNATNFPAASAGAKSNGTAITFPTATGSWGALGYFVVWKHSTNHAAADFIGGGSLAASKTIDSGDTAEFAIGDFDITLT